MFTNIYFPTYFTPTYFPGNTLQLTQPISSTIIMQKFNQGEYGQKIYVNFGEDISTATALTLVLNPKDNITADITTGVTVGTANIDIDDTTYLANEYIEYVVKSDDFKYFGLWRKKGKAQLSATSLVITDYFTFTVLE